MNLPARKPKRRNETRDLVKPIMAALNVLPGVRVWRNNVGQLEWAPGQRLSYGLAIGSADLVGMVRVRTCCEGCCIGSALYRACFFSLEVKWPGKKPTDDQDRWADVVRELGGFCAVVHSVEEARAAVERCRRGENA
jgi:hypothetical protein